MDEQKKAALYHILASDQLDMETHPTEAGAFVEPELANIQYQAEFRQQYREGNNREEKLLFLYRNVPVMARLLMRAYVQEATSGHVNSSMRLIGAFLAGMFEWPEPQTTLDFTIMARSVKAVIDIVTKEADGE